MPDESYKLSFDEHEAVFRSLERKMLGGTKPQAHPKIVILGGQPGSGKSRLADIAKNTFIEGQSAANINGDDYRMWHPKAEEIYKHHGRRFAEMTDPDVRVWTSRLLGVALRERRNIIFESTMRNREPLMTTIKHLSEEGYQVGIMAMAVAAEISRLGVIKRYEDQILTGRIARWTPMEIHDDGYRKLPDVAAAIERESPIDSIQIYNRAGGLLYSNESSNGVFKRPSIGLDAKAAIEHERSRPMTRLETEKLEHSISDVKDNMLKRGASEELHQLSNYLSLKRENVVER